MDRRIEDCQEYVACSQSEQAFVRAYLYGEKAGNGTQAALAAYDTIKPENAANIAVKVLKNRRVQAVIAYAKGMDYISDGAFWSRLRWALDQDQSASVTMRALELIAEIKGFVGKASSKKAATEESDIAGQLAERLSSMPLGTVLKATEPHESDPAVDNS